MYALGFFIFVGNELSGHACMYIWQCCGGVDYGNRGLKETGRFDVVVFIKKE